MCIQPQLRAELDYYEGQKDTASSPSVLLVQSLELHFHFLRENVFPIQSQRKDYATIFQPLAGSESGLLAK